MGQFASRFKYSQWDGTQAPTISADEVLAAISDDLIEYGNMRWALRNLITRGMEPQSGQMEGLRDVLNKLQKKKKERLDRFDISSVMQDIETKLDEILGKEQDRIDEWLNKDNESFSNEILKQIAERNQETLAKLPGDSGGKMKDLEKYEFLNPDAQREYLDLVDELRKAATQRFFKYVENMVNKTSEGDVDHMKEMVKELNEMLVKKIAGEDSDFEAFMDKYSDLFGKRPPESLDELVEQMRQQMGSAQSMMSSMAPNQRGQLKSLMEDRFGDPELESGFRKLAKEVKFLDPQSGRYSFGGTEKLDLDRGMQLMEEMHKIDDLIGQVRSAERRSNPDLIEKELLNEILDDNASDSIDGLNQLLDVLNTDGYIRQTSDDQWELTPRGSRMIGQHALGEIYSRLRHQNLGNHPLPEEGRFGERLEQTKPYEYGDPFHLHMPRTIRNAIERDGPKIPIQLRHEDFEIYRSELATSTATALLVDRSWSMALKGSFQAAKKVALALHNLITSQYPKDSFYIIGFAAYASELKPHDLPFLQWNEYPLGTNMQHALLIAERLLSKHDVGTKQIVMISDGEPTAHLENGHSEFAFPPTAETMRATYQAVKKCTKKGIAINTFMIDENHHLKDFVNELARINSGRVFLTSPEKLGEYILVDYVENKRKKLARR